jgi:cysteine desulfurase/selenocysteine lyase
MSNTAGNIQPFKKITALAHKYGVLVCIDFAQYLPHFAVDFKDVNCDFGCFSAHKIGSSCFGVLIGKKNVLEQCREKIYLKNLKNFLEQYEIPLKPVPQCFEFGSLQISDIVAFSSAMKYFLNLGYQRIIEIESDLKDYFLKKAEESGCLKFLFPIQENYAPIFSFHFKNENIDLIAANKILLNDYQISLSCGTQCAQSLYQHYGYKIGIRASCCFYNTKEEIDYLFAKLKIVSRM